MVTPHRNSFNYIRTNDGIVMSLILAIFPSSRYSHRSRIIISVSFLTTDPTSYNSFQTAALCLNTWFLKKRGLAMGIMVSGSSLGGVCFPIMLKRLFDSVGFGWGVRAAAFLIFGCLVVANFLVRSRLPPPGWTKGRQIFDFKALREPVYVFVIVPSPSPPFLPLLFRH